MSTAPEPTLHELTESLRLLTDHAARSERRLQHLERTLRWLSFALVGSLGLALMLGTRVTGTAWAQEREPSVLGEVESALKRDLDAAREEESKEKAKVESAERKAVAHFKDYMDRVRADVAQAKEFDPGRTIAVVLHDMKRMLEAVPVMAADVHEMNLKMGAMPSMAVDMHEMNYKMGIMSYGVDSTMGRMGRAMPWAPW